MNHYEVVDINSLKRKMHIQIFKDYLEPNFCISLKFDITQFLFEVKRKDFSFTLALIYLITETLNDIEAFRYRFLNDQVVLFDKLDTSFTYIEDNDDLFKVINAPITENIESYIENSTNIIKIQKDYFTGPLGIDIVQFSPLPWLEYTHVSHTISGRGNNSTPLVDWGKYYKVNERIYLPLSIQAHHSFVDGIHVAEFSKKLQEKLNSVKFD